MVSRRRLSGEHECPRRQLELGVLAQTVVKHDHPQRVEQLPLVFMDALDLTVEDGIRIDYLTRGRLQPVSELCLPFAR